MFAIIERVEAESEEEALETVISSGGVQLRQDSQDVICKEDTLTEEIKKDNVEKVYRTAPSGTHLLLVRSIICSKLDIDILRAKKHSIATKE